MPTTTSALRLSDLSPAIMQSEIRAMTVECAALVDPKTGKSCGINMAQGVCDTDPPLPVVDAAIRGIRDGHNIYTRLEGLTDLRQAIAQKLAVYNCISVDPDSQVLVTSGATGGMHAACMALLNPGDEVIVFEPFYGYHNSTLLSMRVQPVVVSLTAPDWALDAAALRKAITHRTRAIIINSPGNPAGNVFSRMELQAIADAAIAADLFVITDEIYEYFLYDAAEHISPATLPGMAERTITLGGFSKTFSVTGWRLGYLAADARWMGSIGYFHDLTYVCAPSPLQYGAAAGLLALPPSFYSAMASEYQAKRDLLCSALQEIGMTPSVPRGAYYVLADSTRVAGANAKEKARNLMRQTGVASVAGTAFFSGGRGENILRFCFAKKDEDLHEACRRLRAL